MLVRSQAKKLRQIRILTITTVLGMLSGFLILLTRKHTLLLQDLSFNNTNLCLMGAMLIPIALLLWLLFKKTREATQLREQFYQSQKMEAIGRLAGGIAHDFNNILSSSTGYAEFLVEDLREIDPKLQNFAKQILRANQQAQKLVEQILTFSRKQQDTELENLDLNNILNDMTNLLAATIKPGIHLETNFPEHPLQTKANANLLHQLVMNLCVNAVDAMIPKERGTLSITASLSKLPEELNFSCIKKAKNNTLFVNHYIRKNNVHFLLNGCMDSKQNYIILQIKDTGTGIPPKTLKKIFDPFFTTKDINKGTGLGLSAAQAILELHKAGLIVKTEQNKGSCFTILIPNTTDIKMQNNEPEQIDDKIDYKTSNIKNIMLVEDDLSVAGALEIMLERMGYKTIHCLNPLEALDALTDGKNYDLIISDYRMPHMNGLEFSREVYTTNPNLPIILITGFSDEKINTKLANTAINTVLKKPIQQSVIDTAIKTALAK